MNASHKDTTTSTKTTAGTSLHLFCLPITDKKVPTISGFSRIVGEKENNNVTQQTEDMGTVELLHVTVSNHSHAPHRYTNTRT